DNWYYTTDEMRAVSVEVSFQETGNSVIVQKKDRAENRKEMYPEKFKSGYVIDGIGNFDFRSAAVRGILDAADIVVTAREDEIQRLAKYIGEWLGEPA
ncbi:uncharacterized protein METZ01_LOCUS427695, partial [marine metagenome]